MMKKRSVRIGDTVSSVLLEDEFWEKFEEIADERNLSVPDLIRHFARAHDGNLASAIRVEVLRAQDQKIARLMDAIKVLAREALDQSTAATPAARRRA